MEVLSRLHRGLVVILYIAAMGYGVMLGFTHTNYNWDMLGYVGTVYAWQEKNPQTMYDKLMADLKAHIPQYAYESHANNPLSSDSNAFAEQLPFYEMKPLYPATIWVMNLLGIPLPVATWTISALCIAALAIVLFFWRTRYLSHEAWLLIMLGLGFFYSWPMVSLARFSTPDALCTLLTTAALYYWLCRQSFGWFCVTGWLSTLARPDALILLSGFTAYFAFLAPKELRQPRKAAILFIAALVITNIIVSHLAGSYGFEKLFIYGYIDRTPHPSQITAHLAFDQYWDILVPSFVQFIDHPRHTTLLLVSLMGCFCYYMKPEPGNKTYFMLLLLTWALLLMRFALWPAWDEARYYFGYDIIILLASGELVAPYARVLLLMLQTHRKTIRGL